MLEDALKWELRGVKMEPETEGDGMDGKCEERVERGQRQACERRGKARVCEIRGCRRITRKSALIQAGRAARPPGRD